MNKKLVATSIALTLLLSAGAFFFGVKPQNQNIANTETELTATQTRNTELRTQIPVLKEQLNNIAPKVDYLRQLSTQVPPEIGLPDLIDEFDQAAITAGVSRITGLDVTLPQLVTPPAPPAPVKGENAPAENVADKETVQDEEDEEPVAVLASYTVTAKISGTLEANTLFVEHLATISRLNVVNSSTYTNKDDITETTVVVRLFLQQVDVDELAAQIEQLAKTTN